MGIIAGVDTFWQAKRGIVQDGLVLNLDAGVKQSYGGTGTVWTDLSGNGNHGTLINGPTYSSDNGGSLVFDGTNDFVNTSPTSILNFSSSDFTVESVSFFDASTASDNVYRTIFSIGDTSTSNYLHLVKWRSGLGNGVNLDYSVNGSRHCITTISVIPSPNVAATIANPLYDIHAKWSHFIITVNSNTMSLYINSVFHGSVSLSQRWDQNQSILIGNRSTWYMKGKIPIIRVYKNKSLTTQEIHQNYNALRGRFGL